MPMTNTPVGDEVKDDCHKDDLVDHLMLQVGLLQMNLMEMSIGHLEVHEDLDDPDVGSGRNDMEHCDVECPNDDDVGEDGSIVIAPSWGVMMVRRPPVLCYHVKLDG